MATAQLSRIILRIPKQRRPLRLPNISSDSTTLHSFLDGGEGGGGQHQPYEKHHSKKDNRDDDGENLSTATYFYQTLFGLTIRRATDEWTEFQELPLILQLVPTTTTTTLTSMTTGEGESNNNNDNNNNNNNGNSSTLLQFIIPDMDRTVAHGLQLGAQLEGPIQYPAHGKVAVLTTPHGHLIGLYEPAMDEYDDDE